MIDTDARALDGPGVLPTRHPFDRPDIDAIWLACASRCGFAVRRGDSVYASTSGRVITLGTPETLDADDCVAVLVLHELCHGLVEGPERWGLDDFGLDNTTDGDQDREYAALRLQAHFADRVALRAFFFPTTEWRSYYEQLPSGDAMEISPLTAPVPEQAIVALARAGAAFARTVGVHGAIERAMAATLAVAERERLYTPHLGRHPIDGPLIDWRQQDLRAETQRAATMPTCGACGWARADRYGRKRCIVHAKWSGAGPRVRDDLPGCMRFERALDCLTCGACCREAYHAVQIPRNDPFIQARPELITRDKKGVFVIRQGSRCSQLAGGQGVPYTCHVYGERPITCREFERGGPNCLMARRRVGLTA